MSTEDRVTQNLDAERSLLGGCLLDNALIGDVASTLAPAHFYRPAHASAYEAILALANRNEPVDRVTLKAELTRTGKFEAVGGDEFVDLLDRCAPTAANLGYYAKIILDASIFREVQIAAVDAVRVAREGAGTPGDLLDDLESKLASLRLTSTSRDPVDASVAMRETFKTLQARYERQEDITGLPSGISDLDRMTSGFQPGDLVILAARPSMGKTAMALGWALHAALHHAREGKRATAAFFSLEQPRSQLTERMLAHEARVDGQRLRTGRILETDWAKLAHHAGCIAEASIKIDDTAGLGLLELRAKARRIATRAPENAPLGLVVVDYLQLMSGPHAETREQEISALSRGLKALAKELQVPVVALSQLNRSLERRPDKRPVMSDLRESGAIEQDADLICFLYREEVYDPENENVRGLAEVIIGKHRNGPIGTARCTFQREFTRFSDVPKQSGPHWQEREEAAA